MRQPYDSAAMPLHGALEFRRGLEGLSLAMYSVVSVLYSETQA